MWSEEKMKKFSDRVLYVNEVRELYHLAWGEYYPMSKRRDVFNAHEDGISPAECVKALREK